MTQGLASSLFGLEKGGAERLCMAEGIGAVLGGEYLAMLPKPDPASLGGGKGGTGDRYMRRGAVHDAIVKMKLNNFSQPHDGVVSDDRNDYSTWQPARLLAMLIEIDPMADRSSEMRFAREDGEEPKVWRSLGTDKRLTLAEIRHNYDALGSFLHTLTIHQLWKGKAQKIDRLRARSQDLVARLEDVLSARASEHPRG